VIDGLKRHRTPTAKAVADFTRVARDQGLDLGYDRSERLAKLLKSEDPATWRRSPSYWANSKTTPSCGGWTPETLAATLPG
jgi:hypothetical protein